MIDAKESTRELIVIHLRPSKDDPLYTRCLWMTVYIDTKAWRLMVDSDCGSYTHSWPNEDALHPFRKALASYLADESYTLSKISKESEFSPEDTMECIRQAYCDDPDMLAMLEEKFDGAYTEHDFYNVLADYDVPGELYEEICHVYPSQAVTVAKLLKEYVAPILRGAADVEDNPK